ncbi:MAG: permease-like cell division protein FtsX, partial [Clostridiales bacterium]|nr:permease-like cell division protein FtsX [Clostridiales bacterium]
YFEEAFKSIIRNRLMSVTSILTVASCILILIFSYCLALNVDYILEQFENAIGISVYFNKEATAAQIEALREQLLDMPEVDEVVFISAEEALDSFAKDVGNEGMKTAYENDNPLPRSFTITLKNVENQGAVLTALGGMKDAGIEQIVDAEEVIGLLSAVNQIIRAISVIIVLVLGVLSVIIIMNTIKLTVNNRRNDIGIMKYVGATDWFIKWPFMIEGIVIGVVGALVPVGLAALGYGGAISLAENAIQPIISLDLKQGYEVFPSLTPVMILLGVFIGALGSVLSMRKYLDV